MTRISEDLTNIEEALEAILEFRHGGADVALAHDYDKAGQALAGKIAGGLTKLSHKLQTRDYQNKLKQHSTALNQAHADFETHKATGNKAGMALAQNNIKYHTGQVNTYANNLRAGGNTVNSTPTPAQQQQHAQQQQAAAQKKAARQAKQQAKAQQTSTQTPTSTAQPKSSVTPGAQRSAQVAAARKSGNSAAVRNLAHKFAKEDRRAAGTLKEAYELAESLIISLLEGMESRNKGAIIKKVEIIKDGKPHVKGTFVETDVMKGVKPTSAKRKEICKKASRKAEGLASAIKREVSKDFRNDMNL